MYRAFYSSSMVVGRAAPGGHTHVILLLCHDHTCSALIKAYIRGRAYMHIHIHTYCLCIIDVYMVYLYIYYSVPIV